MICGLCDLQIDIYRRQWFLYALVYSAHKLHSSASQDLITTGYAYSPWCLILVDREMQCTNYLGSSFQDVRFIISVGLIFWEIFGIHDDVIKWKHFPRYWPFVRGIHRSPVNSPYKGQWRGALMFSLIGVWITGWVNNPEAGDLRRHRAHYDVTVMRKSNNGTIPNVPVPQFTRRLIKTWVMKCKLLRLVSF